MATLHQMLFSRVKFGWLRSNQPGTVRGYIRRVDLSTGGFIEIVEDCTYNTSYIRIHLGQPKHSHDLDETYKYVRYGTDREAIRLLRELHKALTALVNNTNEVCRAQFNVQYPLP
jgi:hypothetical protein